MVVYTHEKTALLIGVESTYGTEVSTTTKVGTIRSIAPNLSWAVSPVQGAGDGREVQSFVRTRFNARIGIVVELHDFSILRHAVGPLSGDGSSGDPYIITEADTVGTDTSTDITPFSAEVGSEGSTEDVDTYTGCVIDNFTLDFVLGEPVVGSFEIITQKVTSSTSKTSYSPLTTKPFYFHSGTFKWGTTPSSVSKVRSVRITYRNNLIVYGDWGTPLIAQPEAGKREILWSATLVMTDSVASSLRDDFYGQSNSPVTAPGSMPFTSNNELHIVLDEGSSSGDKDATIQLDHCIIESISKPIDIGSGDLVLVTFTGRAATSKSDEFVTWYTN